MNESLEFKQTINYLLKHAKKENGRYKVSISYGDIYYHHFLLSVFNHMQTYLDYSVNIQTENTCTNIPLINEIQKQGKNITIIFNATAIEGKKNGYNFTI